jgi:hypothetical protein
MKSMKPNLLCSLLALGVAAGLSSCSTTPSADLDAKTDTVLSAMSAKLSAAKALRVSVTRTASPGFNAGMIVAERASGTVAVQKPNKVAAQLKTSEGTRAIGFDGSNLTVVDHAAKTHSVVKATGDIDHAVRAIQKIYGLTPPLGELIANNPKALLLDGVKTGKCTGTESIHGVECDRLAFTQDGLSWQLWVATGDKLPRRISLSYPNGEGGAPLTMTATITKWELNAALSAAELNVKAPAGSRALEMIPLQ